MLTSNFLCILREDGVVDEGGNPPGGGGTTPPEGTTSPEGTDTGNSGMQAAINNMNKSGEPPATPEFTVSQEFADREWAKNIKSQRDLEEQFDNNQKLIGRKGVLIPGENATEQEWAEYHRSMGVPASADDYELPQIEALKEYERTESDLAEDKAYKELFKKHNVPKETAAKLYQDYKQQLFDQEQAQTQEFNQFLDQLYGKDNNVKSEKLAKFKEALQSSLDAKYLPLIDRMDNASKLLLAGVTEMLHKRYGQAGTFIEPKTGNTGSTGRTQDSIQQDLIALHSKYHGVKPFTQEYQEYQKQENALKSELDKVLSKNVSNTY